MMLQLILGLAMIAISIPAIVFYLMAVVFIADFCDDCKIPSPICYPLALVAPFLFFLLAYWIGGFFI